MKKYYAVSRIVICVLTIVITNIAFINEDISMKLAATVVFTIAALISCFVATPISRWALGIGDKISNRGLRAVYYIALLPLILLIVYLLCMLIMFISDHIEHSNEMGAALGHAILTVFLCVAVFVALIVPYVQTLIVLLLRGVLKDKQETDRKDD